MCNETTNEELRCKICGKLASEDSHFYPRKMLCNRHYLQMHRYGEILSDNKSRHKYEKVCDICGDAQSGTYKMWHSNDEYNGKVLCGKHYAQLRRNGKIIDEFPASHIPVSERVCDICGSNHHVIYYNGSYYCWRHYSQIKKLGGLKDITVFDRNEYYIKDNIGYIILRNVKNENIAEVKVDVEDIDKLIKHKWSLGTWGYASTNINNKNILMQRFIMNEFEVSKIIDHINRDKLDNRKENLRIVNKSINAINVGIRTNNKSGVTGISWNKNANSWRAYINYQGKRIELGHRKNFEDAVRLRLNAENQYYAGMQPQKELFEQYGVEIV